MTSPTFTDEEYARFIRASPYRVEKEQQVAAAPIPSQGSSASFGNLGELETDSDEMNPSLFQEEFEQIFQAADDFQWDIAGSQLPDFFSAVVDPRSTQDDTSGHQDIPPQGQVSHSFSGSINQVCAPITTNGLQVLLTTPAPSSSFPLPPPAPPAAAAAAAAAPPSAPAGINPDILAGALQAAITAPGPTVTAPTVPGPSAPTWPAQSTTTPSPFAPPPPQTFFLTAPQPSTASTATQVPTNMVVPYYPQPQAPEILSDYPQLHRTHHTTGYRDGLTHARNQTSQPAFDAGFPVGMHYGSRVGRVLGLLEFALAGATHQLGYEIMARANSELEVGPLVRDIEAEMGIVRDGALNGNGNVNVNWGPGVQMGWTNGDANGNANANANYMAIQPVSGELPSLLAPHPLTTSQILSFPILSYTNNLPCKSAVGTYTPPYFITTGPHQRNAQPQQQQQQHQPQLQISPPHAQPPTTVLRLGPPANFICFHTPDEININDPKLYANQLPYMHPLTAAEALRRWESFAADWLGKKCTRAARTQGVQSQ